MSRQINRTANATNRAGSRARRPDRSTSTRAASRAVRPRGTGTKDKAASMAKKERISLELMELEINKNARKGWDCYLVLAIEDPNKPNKSIVSVWPEYPIEMKKSSNNKYNFAGRGKGVDGKQIYSGFLPADRQISMHAFVLQDKGKARRAGEVLKEVTGFIDKGAKSLGPAAAANPYVAAAVVVNKGLGMVGAQIAKMKDKSRGMVTLDERFEDAYVKRKTQRRVKFTSTRELKLTCRWIIEKVG